MRVLVQRVKRASVKVDGARVGEIDHGLLLLTGVGPDDGDDQLAWMARKLAALRIFADDAGRMNRSLRDVDGGALVVSQFTLYGDCRKGNRPSFIGAAPPEVAEQLVERFIEHLWRQGISRVASGVFGAMMDVELINDGPVTLWLER